MTHCRGCGTVIVWARNVKTRSGIPLVPADEDPANMPHRYRHDGDTGCIPDPKGPWMSQFRNCPSANQFNRRSARE